MKNKRKVEIGRRAEKMKMPKHIEKLKDTCFSCNSKFCKSCGGMIVKKLEIILDNKSKKQYIFSRFAPLGCYLANNKKQIMGFYKNKELIKMWRKKKGEQKK